MTHHQSSQPAVTHQHTNTEIGTGGGAGSGAGDLYEAAFSTTGPHPQCGVALTRTITEARQRLADMLILCDPRHHVVADIPRLTRGETVETYDGTTGDIFAQVNASGVTDIDEPVPYVVTARPLTPTTATTTETVGER